MYGFALRALISEYIRSFISQAFYHDTPNKQKNLMYLIRFD